MIGLNFSFYCSTKVLYCGKTFTPLICAPVSFILSTKSSRAVVRFNFPVISQEYTTQSATYFYTQHCAAS